MCGRLQKVRQPLTAEIFLNFKFLEEYRLLGCDAM
jgi:hypothetical protein